MSNFTPGPYYPKLRKWDKYPTLLGEDGTSGNSIEQAVANARLIAAAPELLAACERTLDIINSYSHITAIFKACTALQGAIAQAKGES